MKLKLFLFVSIILLFVACTKPQGQVLEVTPTGEGSNATAVLTIDGKQIFETQCFIGQNGVGKTREGDKKTPLGEMRVLEAFGILPNPGTSIPYIDVTPSVFCCDDSNYYNQIIDTAAMHYPSCTGEEMYSYQPHYNYGLTTSYNEEGIEGLGCCIFVHCKGNNPYTAGCIALDEDKMRELLVRCDTTLRIIVNPMPECYE
ncbi:MAG: L,D-transpeptidase family protein [Paludibacteraceae bacterium]|nr:L,D-transpeptidase family protein [Paludibacteraceae bacterium]